MMELPVTSNSVERARIVEPRSGGDLTVQNERYEAALRGSADGIWDWIPQSGQIYFSDRVAELFGKKPSELPKSFSSWIELFAPEDATVALESVYAHLDVGAPCDFEFRMKIAGETRWFHARGKVQHDRSGAPTRLAGSITDVTNRKLAEEALRAREARMRAILNHTADGIITIDEGRIDSFNRAAERIFGYAEAEVVGKDIWGLVMTAEGEDLDEDSVGDDEAPDRPSGVSCEMVGKRKDGTTFPLEMSLSEVTVGERRLVTALMRDISERKRAEADQRGAEIALREAKEAAERASRAKTEFLANMSHEIRTPLNAILGMADLLAEARLDSEAKQYVRIFRRASESLLAIVNDILDLSKVEAEKLEIETIPFDLHEVVALATEATSVRAIEKSLELSAHVEPEAPRYLVGDPNRVKQVLLNLLGNAVKFTAQGSVSVNVRPVAAEESSVVLEFSVTDTGMGIPEDKLATIFDRFSQVDTSTTRVHGGTGLGLAICRSLVGLMGGKIWASSAKNGRGTTMRFTARFGISPIAVGPASTSTVASVKTVQEPRKILLVEDNPDNRALVLAYLKGTPHHVLVADNGEAAVEMALAYRFDLVLMDMQMPIMDGYEATRRIRAFEKEHARPPMRIIALTAHAMQEESERTRAAGCDAHLSKPIRKQHLLQAISDYTANSTQDPPPPPAQRTVEVVAPPVVVHVESDILDLVPGYLDNRRADLVTLRQHLNRRAFEPLRVIAHGIAGSGGAYGFPDLTRMGRVLQQAAQAGDIPKIQRLLDEMEVYLESVEVARR